MKIKIANLTACLLSVTILGQSLPAYANTLKNEKILSSKQSQDFSKFDVTKAFDKDLYYARSILNSEGQKAWDVALDTLLKYDNTNKKYPKKDSEGNYLVEINYKELGIKIDKTQAQYVQKYLVRQEPRMFHLKDWGADVVTSKDGFVEKQIFHIGNGAGEGDKYQQLLKKIDIEANKILSVVKDDMTIYQKIQAVQKEFEKSLSYNMSAPSPSDLRGAFLDKQAICGGYSKGFEYLLLKMGIENIWVNGYAGGPHAWNHVYIDGKWYLMDTTWGGENWYLRGEVENHGVYDTYHIIPPLAKEGIPYNWGQYPGVWLETNKKVVLPINSNFNPLDYIKDFGDVYGTDLKNNIVIKENTVDTKKEGKYKVVYELKNKDNQVAKSVMEVEVLSGKAVPLTSLENKSGNFEQKPVSLYFNGKENPYEDGLFKSEEGYMTFDISKTNPKYFEANVGINKNVRDNTAYGHYGKVQFEVYADDKLLYTSKILGWKDNFEHIFVEIPEGTKTIKLVNVPKGSGNNHGAWGDAKLYTQATELEKAKQNLKDIIDFSDKITDISYVLDDNHKNEKYENFLHYRAVVKEQAKTANDVDTINQLIDILEYNLMCIGQNYVAGGTPISK